MLSAFTRREMLHVYIYMYRILQPNLVTQQSILDIWCSTCPVEQVDTGPVYIPLLSADTIGSGYATVKNVLLPNSILSM